MWAISMSIEPTPKLMNILYALANSRLPWGVEWDNYLPLCSGLTDDETGEEYEGYVLCCGHTIKHHTESSPLVGSGLLLAGDPDRHGRPTLIITKVGRAFLDQHRNMVEFDG